jgi:thiol-disulfide isomerase/thioredoxin
MLEPLQKGAYNLLTDSRIWMILVVIIFFLVVTFYVYNKYVTPLVEKNYIPNNEFPMKDKVDEVDIYLFTVNWCPHSKKALPVWEELKTEYNQQIFNGYKLNFIQVDGEENQELADKYKVEGFPTIKLVKGTQIIEYDAKPTTEHLKEFLNSVLTS